MATDFQEFLKQKTAGSDIRERNRSRLEWLGSLSRLNDQIRDWLREADPEELVEVVPYEVRRAEARIGIYDALALKIRLNADELDVLPIGRYAIGPLPSETIQALLQVTGTDGPAAGRVDMTDGEKKYILMRDLSNQSERWWVVSKTVQVERFDRDRLEAILQDFWS